MTFSIYKKMAVVILGVLLFPIVGFSADANIPDIRKQGWVHPVDYQKYESCFQFGQYKGHVGDDLCRQKGTPVYAIADGCVENYNPSLSYYGDANGGKGGAILLRHQTSSGRVFYAVYGHSTPKDNYLNDKRCNSGDYFKIKAGDPIATVHPYTGKDGKRADHLHFGIHPDVKDPIKEFRGNGCTQSDNCGWKEPFSFLQYNSPFKLATEIQAACQGIYCWEPKEASCERASKWYITEESKPATSTGSQMCADMKNALNTIVQAPNPNQNIPDEHFWQSWWRGFLNSPLNIFKVNPLKADTTPISNFTVVRTINVLSNKVVGGNGMVLGDSTGAGYPTPATDPVIKNSLPDFVTRKTWLVNESNIESYRYTPSQTIGMNAKFANIGTQACMGAKKIKVHFYLSKGYKEDNHSVWKLVGTDEIKCSNLRPNATKVETEGLQISKYNLAVGSINNIVTCIDHPKTDHNNGGDFKEKHESNNCSTEAVFEVIAESTSPNPVINPTNLPPFAWSSAGVIPNMTCTRILEASDPHTWSDNYFCADKDYSIRWSSAGAVAGMRCTRVIEPADPDTWRDNYICLPNDSPIAFSWSPAGAIAGKECTQWTESADPHSWNDNFLCYESSSTPRPVPYVDFTTNGFQWLSAAPYYAGDQARLGGNVYTDGTMNSPAAIRSSYSVECSGTGKVLLTDDGTEANNLIVGKNNWEENIAAVTMPNVSGSCTAYFCADYQGAVSESNEVNNCSSLSFDLQPRPIPYVDFTTNGFQWLQAPYYAGDQARLGGNVYTNGTMNSPAAIRSSYSVECSGTGKVLLTDDGTEANDLTVGKNNWEENIAVVTMPNVSGSCTAYFCADYQGAVNESDEANNCSSFPFELQPRPKPNLVITQFQDQKGCCTTNTGEYVSPDIWIRNDGQVSPSANVRVLYQISSPAVNNGAFLTIGYGVIEPRELPSGGTDEDYMDDNGGRWRIPSDSAWKNQWHTVKACINPQGDEPTGAGSDICMTYARYSKK